jgi:hypothetical protein
VEAEHLLDGGPHRLDRRARPPHVQREPRVQVEHGGPVVEREAHAAQQPGDLVPDRRLELPHLPGGQPVEAAAQPVAVGRHRTGSVLPE